MREFHLENTLRVFMIEAQIVIDEANSHATSATRSPERFSPRKP